MNKYVILEERYMRDLQKGVNHRLELGWELQGGVSVYMKPTGTLVSDPHYVQAMYLKEKK